MGRELTGCVGASVVPWSVGVAELEEAQKGQIRIRGQGPLPEAVLEKILFSGLFSPPRMRLKGALRKDRDCSAEE